MKDLKQFDSLKCPLKGINIIEAGAGTGKTYNIQNLYARMIIEKDIDVSSILVVTFTEAATKELKDRIRSILVQIQNYFNEHPVTNHQSLITNHNRDSNYKHDDRITAIIEATAFPIELKKRRIDSALRNFDTASIFTIHGFCNRLLNDFSFESNILFNLELETNPEAIIQDIIEDFWRIENYSSNNILTAALLIKNQISIESLMNFIRACIAQPSIELEPELNLSNELRLFSSLFNQLKNSFNKAELIEMLSGDFLNQSKYKPTQVLKLALELEAFLDGIIGKDTFKNLEKLTPDKIRSGIKKGNEDKFKYFNHEIFLLSEKLYNLKHIVDLYSLLIKTKCKNYFFSEYSKRKQQLNIQTFDDLLNKVSDIVSQGNSKLKKAAVSKFKAAMIDEFQDTDSVQYNIFKKLFIETGKPVFLVGDPKQAIYAFRGGDIFTYQRAKNENKNGNFFSLTTNWRSADNMIESINTVFIPGSISELPFADENILYQRALSSKKKNELLLNDKSDKNPLKIILANGEFNKTELEKQCAKITAHLIYQTLTNRNLKIEELQSFYKKNPTITNCEFTDNDSDKNKNLCRTVMPEDIAVLVNSHLQARMIKKALREYNIPAVLQATGSVFDTDEAEHFEYILKAVANPNNSNLITGALLTNILGYTPDKIIELTSDDNIENQMQYEEILSLFKILNDICINRSFIEMYNTLSMEFKIKESLLKQIDGERKFTNLSHISELLHDKELNTKIGLNGLIAWLSKQRNKATREDKEEYEIRLETDNKAVKVMTVHKSKGLEFPIVYCPFLWKNYAIPYNIEKVTCKYHKDGKTILNLNDNTDALRMFYDEQLQELIRVFYVAVTRAKYQCYLIWGKIKDTGQPPTSALDYIFKYKNNGNFTKGSISTNLENFGFDSPDIKNSEHLSMYSLSPLSITPENYFSKENSKLKNNLTCRSFDNILIEHNWKISSFSALAPHETDSEFLFNKDNDEFDNNTDNDTEITVNDKTDIFNFPAGAKTGTCWHAIFENLDFSTDDQNILLTVNQLLADYCLFEAENKKQSLENQKCVFNMVKNTLNTKLKNADNITLSFITNSNKLTELEFNFSLKKGFYTKDISNTVFEYSKQFGFTEKIQIWNDDFIKGYMTGFIDLIFRHNDKYYIIDWKSNKLDNRPANFEQRGLKKEIAKNYYFLQYLIYTVALDRFLDQTLPYYTFKKYFGGIYYVFLRGVDENPDSERGFFFDRPEESLIKKLSNLF